jgi:anti-sigma B factor antagonist
MAATRILQIEGELDMNTAGAVRQELTAAIESRTPRIVLDLTGLTYIDSSGLALFIESMQRLQKYGGKLALFGLRDTIRHTLEVAKLDQVFAVYPDKSAALAAA